MSSKPPTIFSNARRTAVMRRSGCLQDAPDAARFVYEDIADDMAERLAFVRHVPQKPLLLGHISPLAARLTSVTESWEIQVGSAVDLEQPYPFSGFDFIGCVGLLDTVNDLPGALIHMKSALAPGGIVIASFVGAGSLSSLRKIMLAADGDRPAPRVHPHIDIQAASGLLQRTGWSDPVVDSHTLRVRYSSLQRLVQDLRDQGLGNVLASRSPALGKAGYARALDAFAVMADSEGRITETFEIITVTGRRR